MDDTDRFEMLLRQNPHYFIPSNNHQPQQQQQQQPVSNFDYMSTVGSNSISEQDYGMDPLLPSSSSPYLNTNSYNRNNSNNNYNRARQFSQCSDALYTNYNNINTNNNNNSSNSTRNYHHYGGRNIVEQQQQFPMYYNQNNQHQQHQQHQQYPSNFCFSANYYNQQQRIKIEPERITPTNAALTSFQPTYSKNPYCNRKFSLPSSNNNGSHLNYMSKIENVSTSSSFDNESEDILVPVSDIVPQCLNQYTIHSNINMPSTSTVPCFSPCTPTTMNYPTVPSMMMNISNNNNNKNNHNKNNFSTTAYNTNHNNNNSNNNNAASSTKITASTGDSTLISGISVSGTVLESMLQDKDISELFNGWYNAMKHILWKILTPGVLYEGEINGPDRVNEQMIQKLKSCLKTPKSNDSKKQQKKQQHSSKPSSYPKTTQQKRNCEKLKTPIQDKGELLSQDLNNNKFHYEQVYVKTSTMNKKKISLSSIENRNNNKNNNNDLTSNGLKVWANKCPVCKLTLVGGLQRFEAHMKNCHHLQCKCGLVFTSKLLFTKHLQKIAEEGIDNPKISIKDHEIIPGDKIKPVFECDLCDEIFRSRNPAVKHRENHFSPPPESPTSTTTNSMFITRNNLKDDETSPSSSSSTSSSSSSCEKRNSRQKLVQAFSPSIVNTYSLAPTSSSSSDETKKRKMESSINLHLASPFKKLKTLEVKMPKLKKIPMIPKQKKHEKMELVEEEVVNMLEVEALFTNEKSNDYIHCNHQDHSSFL